MALHGERGRAQRAEKREPGSDPHAYDVDSVESCTRRDDGLGSVSTEGIGEHVPGAGLRDAESRTR